MNIDHHMNLKISLIKTQLSFKVLISKGHGCDCLEAEAKHDAFNMVHASSLHKLVLL
jgi:hypothetical protein